jgi:hypothetical protein
LEFKVISLSESIKYEIYALEIKKGEEKKINMNHVCAIQNIQAKKLDSRFSSSGQQLHSLISLEKSKNYLLNLIVTDSDGRVNSFNKPIYIPEKIVIPTSQNRISLYPLDWIISMFFFQFLTIRIALQIVAYLVFGMLFKKIVYKSTGLNLIPNIEFWRSTPFILKNACNCSKLFKRLKVDESSIELVE